MAQVTETPQWPGTTTQPTMWQRVRAWFDVEPEEPREALEEYRDLNVPMPVGARGGVFDFKVFPLITWRSTGLTRAELNRCIDEYTPAALKVLHGRAADSARAHLPHYADRFEAELNDDLKGRDWLFPHTQLDVRFQLQVRVHRDDRIRESLQPYWQRRIEMEFDHELGMRRAELIRERTEAWSAILEKLADNPVTAHAAALTEAPFAQQFQALRKTREEAATRLTELLENAIRGHQAVGLYEYAESYDAALQAFRKQAGLPIGDNR